MNDKFNILSTKALEPAIIKMAGKLGFRIDEKAFIEVQYLEGNEIASEWKKICDLPQKKLLVFTSKNAVEAIISTIDSDDTTKVSRNSIVESWPIASISGRTMETVQKEFPHARTFAIAKNADQLGKAISENISKEYLVVFPCGDIHRPELPEHLRSEGFIVNEWIVYRSVKTPVKIQNAYQGILFFSPSAVESFFSVNKLHPETICFAVGATTAQSVKRFSANHLFVTENPSQESMLELMETYFIDRNNNELLGKNKNEGK
ncbi:MAG: hypothetical protein C5B52_01120 [Bacteroidetes bacterium]|nr:MAG: hypothetical protein C5B52_01120 [Bacteroidota bacterium]